MKLRISKVTQFSILYRTNYGISKRTGWCCVVNGHSPLWHKDQFTSFWKALFNEWEDIGDEYKHRKGNL
jgi:hypothetical protein